MLPLWPHQVEAKREVLASIAKGERTIVLTVPTGGGKTRIACELTDEYLRMGLKVSLYTNRKVLVQQLQSMVKAHGLQAGVRAAGYKGDGLLDVQISSSQTEQARVLRSGRWAVFPADLVIVDEAHLQTGKKFQQLLVKHLNQGAVILGLTATPLDLAGIYDYLIRAGTMRQLRECGAIVPARHYGPDEPNLKYIKTVPGEDLSEKANSKAIMTPTIFGRVYSWWQKLNPDTRPTILFGPGVGESIWFAEQFHARGVAAAHIDGEDVWVGGKLYRSSASAREDILNGSKEGRIPVVCNRFVLREGVDAPWLTHGIFATVIGSLQSYLQAGGRLLRGYPGVDVVTVQDHGGNWWRHGSLNEERAWRLGDTAAGIARARAERLRAKKKPEDREPVCCPRCGLVLLRDHCTCGFIITPANKVRRVVEIDGSYTEMHGDIFVPRQTTGDQSAEKKWRAIYWRCRKAGKTFRQAEGLFAKENGYQWPDRSLPLMPKNEADFFRRIADVPFDQLFQREAK